MNSRTSERAGCSQPFSNVQASRSACHPGRSHRSDPSITGQPWRTSEHDMFRYPACPGHPRRPNGQLTAGDFHPLDSRSSLWVSAPSTRAIPSAPEGETGSSTSPIRPCSNGLLPPEWSRLLPLPASASAEFSSRRVKQRIPTMATSRPSREVLDADREARYHPFASEAWPTTQRGHPTA